MTPVTISTTKRKAARKASPTGWLVITAISAIKDHDGLKTALSKYKKMITRNTKIQ